MTKTIRWTLEPAQGLRGGRVRRLLAAALRRAGARLTRAARALRGSEPREAQSPPIFEFYAEAGAPEGALYVDGKLVGVVEGVRRL